MICTKPLKPNNMSEELVLTPMQEFEAWYNECLLQNNMTPPTPIEVQLKLKELITIEQKHLEFFWWNGFNLNRVSVDQDSAERFYNTTYNVKSSNKIIEVEKQ